MARRLTILALALVGLAGPASAVDGKDLPGNACLPKYNHYQYQRSGSEVRNKYTTTVTQQWYCPLPKDSANDFTGDMTVIDDEEVGSVSCTMYSRSRTGTVLGFSTRTSLAGVQTTPQTLPRFSKLNGITHSHAYFECTLPPGTTIVSFEIDEDDGGLF